MRMRGRFCESGTRCFVLLATALRGPVRVARGGFVELFRRVPPLVSDSRETTHACLLVTREMATTTTQTTTGLLLCVCLPVFFIAKSRLDAPKATCMWPCSSGLPLSVAAVSWSCSRGSQSHMSKTKVTIPTTGNREHKGKVRLTAPRQEKKNKARPDIGPPRDLDASCVVSAVFCLSCLFTLYTPVLESASV